MAVNIKPMTGEDLNFALSMSDAENWGYLRSDFERLLRQQPDGCFISRGTLRRTGLITTVSHGDYGFMGTLIVDSKHRRQGVGEALFVRAFNFLRDRSTRTIELDGVFRAISLYRRLGFTDKYLSLRFLRPPSQTVAATEAVRQPDPQRLLDFDRELLGIDRSDMLKRYCEDFREHCLVLGNDRIDAYAFVKPRAAGRLAIGPLVARSTADAGRLLRAVVAEYANSPLAIGVPERQSEFVQILRDAGFQYVNPSLRMYWGELRDLESNVYGIMAPEKG